MESTGINRLLLHLDSTHMRAAIKAILVWDYSSHPFFRVRLEEAIKRNGDKIFHFDWSYAIWLKLTNLSDGGDKHETDRTPHDFPPINLRSTFSLGDFCIPSTKHLFGSREWLVCCIKLRRDVFIATCTISANQVIRGCESENRFSNRKRFDWASVWGRWMAREHVARCIRMRIMMRKPITRFRRDSTGGGNCWWRGKHGEEWWLINRVWEMSIKSFHLSWISLLATISSALAHCWQSLSFH